MQPVAETTTAPAYRAGISWLEKALVVFALLFIFKTIRGLIGGDFNLVQDRTSGNLLFQVIAIGFYGTGILILMSRFPVWLPRLLARSWPLFALVALTLVSALWSDYPLVTLRRSVALILTMMFAIYVVGRFPIAEFVNVLAVAVVCYLAIGFAALAVPDIAFHQIKHVGNFRGFVGHKNELGRVAAMIAVLALVLRYHGRMLSWLCVPICIGALIALIMSGSATPLISGAATLMLTPLITLALTGRRGRYRFSGSLRATLAVIIVAVLVPVIVVGLPYVLELVGRDLTLSGRTKLWGYAVQLGMERPWLGAGYRSFWTDANTIYFAEFFSWGGDKGPDQGHSGYLDLWLEMGVAGVVAYAVFLASALICIARLFDCGHPAEGLLLSTMFVFLMIYSITEKVILLQSEGVWFMSMLAYFYGMAAGLRATAAVDGRDGAERPAVWRRQTSQTRLSREVFR